MELYKRQEIQNHFQDQPHSPIETKSPEIPERTDENPIPLPPRDRNKPLLTIKPRHTRKHPLIIPPSSLQTTLNKFTIPTPPPQIPSSDPFHSISDPVYSNHIVQGRNGDFDFDAQIESNMAALDNISPVDQDCVDGITEDTGDDTSGKDEVDDSGDKIKSHHVSCEDLLEFADTKPSSRARGNDSDQVRIMQKVFRNTVSDL